MSYFCRHISFATSLAAPPNYLPILVPALGLLVPFIIRWIENKSRLSQARHLLQVINTRDEIDQILQKAREEKMALLENEEHQLRYYQKELEKEIKRNNTLEIRIYPILISIEMVFFISAVFTRAVSFLANLVYAQGDQTLPFLEGIFSDPNIRIGLLVFCVIISIYLTHRTHKRMEMRRGASTKTELLAFGVFNLIFTLTIFILGAVLYLLDLVIPWF